MVHVWRPPRYQDASAGTLVYVDGHKTTSEGAWRDHDLAQQLKPSRQNALFIVTEAASGSGEPA